MAQRETSGKLSDRSETSHRPLFQDLSTAYSSITARPSNAPRPEHVSKPTPVSAAKREVASATPFRTVEFAAGESFEAEALPAWSGDEHSCSPKNNSHPFFVTPVPPPPPPPPVSSLSPAPLSCTEAQGAPLDHRHVSNLSEGLSSRSSLGDAREHLGLSPQIPSITLVDGRFVFSRSPSSVSGKASSGVLAENVDDQGPADGVGADPGTTNPEHDGQIRRSQIRSAHSGDLASVPEHEGDASSSSQAQSRSLLDPRSSVKASGSSLESDITRELRRVSHMSGMSNLSGSIVLLNEDGLHLSSVEGSSKDMGPGSSQSASGQDPAAGIEDASSGSGGASSSTHAASDRAIFTDSEIPKMWTETGRRGKVTAKGSFAASLPSTRGSGSDPGGASVKGFEDVDDEEGDWETVADSAIPSALASRSGFTHAVTGSSLADTSSCASLSPEHPILCFPLDARGLVQHPADERYNHVYRVRRTAPNGEPMLLPAYNFEGGMGFPNRNAWTPPSPVSPSLGNPYQHPTPLSNDHVHPFRSSPPVLMSSGRAISRTYDTPPEVDHLSRTSQDPLRQFNFAFEPAEEGSGNVDVPGQSPHVDAINSRAAGFHVRNQGMAERSPVDLSSPASRHGSFSKVTMLGPRMNLTGTPQGTGMREVGSSLAGVSSSPNRWSSSPKYPESSPTFPNAAALPRPGHVGGYSRGNKVEGSPRGWYDSVRAHREVLTAEGLLPRSGSPPGRGPVSDSRYGISPASHGSSVLSVSPSPTTYLQAFARPVSYNPTAPVPRSPSQQMSELEYRLRRPYREDSSIAPMTCKRKQTLSRVVLASCLLFPPSLLLYGYGTLDTVMVALTNGQVEHFGEREKKLALGLGWSIATMAVIGIVIGMIILAVQK